MGRYIIRRLLWALVLLVLVIALTFAIFYLLPSADPAQLRAGRNATAQNIADIRHNLGLDKPVYVQFWDYLKAVVLHFDLGYSYQSDASVKSLILDRLPATVSLAAGAIVIWMLVGIPVGVISAVRRRSLLDRAAMTVALIGVSVPVFWLGLVLLYLFAADIGKFPLLPGANTYVPLTSDPVKWLTSLIMPWFVLAASSAAVYARLLRGSLIETMQEDYIRTARAKGLLERTVVMRHGLRSALTPLVTVMGLDIGVLLGGALLTETVFNVPGIGRLNYEAIVHSDYPIIQGTVLVAAIFIILANIAVDIVYAFLDPRVRYS
ncbi:MAG: peptide/nickel transport system permease protein [Solirubrobacteraceae bacterium]|jgi:peptide/nickel transport system permease protein|nr:peptide/nickel transport system permease protein [Solirubrobacteraceae bacterium]